MNAYLYVLTNATRNNASVYNVSVFLCEADYRLCNCNNSAALTTHSLCQKIIILCDCCTLLQLCLQCCVAGAIVSGLN